MILFCPTASKHSFPHCHFPTSKPVSASYPFKDSWLHKRWCSCWQQLPWQQMTEVYLLLLLCWELSETDKWNETEEGRFWFLLSEPRAMWQLGNFDSLHSVWTRISHENKHIRQSSMCTMILPAVTVTASVISFYSSWYLQLVFGYRIMFDKLIDELPLATSLVINNNELFRRIKSIRLPYMGAVSLQT